MRHMKTHIYFSSLLSFGAGSLCSLFLPHFARAFRLRPRLDSCFTFPFRNIFRPVLLCTPYFQPGVDWSGNISVSTLYARGDEKNGPTKKQLIQALATLRPEKNAHVLTKLQRTKQGLKRREGGPAWAWASCRVSFSDFSFSDFFYFFHVFTLYWCPFYSMI
jgi:hypothetical protein